MGLVEALRAVVLRCLLQSTRTSANEVIGYPLLRARGVVLLKRLRAGSEYTYFSQTLHSDSVESD